jgi:hypothetical protein
MLRMACRVCVTALLGALAATPASAIGIATVTEVINEGYRQPPGDQERRASTSDELVSDEALRTDRDSRIAVKFVDGSELAVEASSEVVLSDYIFDPASAKSKGVIALNSGLFHFNSNNVADDGIVLQTPVATIGIRGTQFLVTVADEVTIVDILEGSVEVQPTGGGKGMTCVGGQSVLVAGARSDAMCGDLGSFATAAAAPTQQASVTGNNGREHEPNVRDVADRPDPEPSDSGGKPGGGKPGGGKPGGGDPDPDPDPGNGGGSSGNHSGHGDGSNPGRGDGKGHSKHSDGGGAGNPGKGDSNGKGGTKGG